MRSDSRVYNLLMNIYWMGAMLLIIGISGWVGIYLLLYQGMQMMMLATTGPIIDWTGFVIGSIGVWLGIPVGYYTFLAAAILALRGSDALSKMFLGNRL